MQIQPYKRVAHFYETDQMGIIHHSNYIRWFEECRVDFMDQMGYSYHKTTQLGVDIAVVDMYCKYQSMVRFDDRVKITMQLKQLTPVRMVVTYTLTDAQTGELRTTGESTHCFLDRTTHELVRLDRKIPELYENLKQFSASQ